MARPIGDAGAAHPHAAQELAEAGYGMKCGLEIEFHIYRINEGGLNPQLDDRSPARLLRDGDLDDAGPKVLTAARAFAATG